MPDHGAFAPAAVVRAARFGVGRLRDLDREALWDRTVGDPRFLRALCLSNPGVAEFVEKIHRPGGRGPKGLDRSTRSKRVVNAERTLYRYLARAVGRTEPCDAWAGVSIATFGATTSVEPGPDRVAVAPDLRPFEALLVALGRRPEVRRRGRFAVNPTLRIDGSLIRWTVHHQDHELLGTPTARRLVERLDQAPTGWDAWHDRLSATLVDRCIDQGLLVGGSRLPPLFESAWDALASTDLPADLAASWSTTVQALRKQATELEGFEGLAPHQLRAHLCAGRTAIRELYAAVGEPQPELPRTVFRVDVGLPVRVVLGSDAEDRLGRALDAYARFQHGHALGPALWRASLDRLGSSGPMALGTPVGPMSADLASPVARWEALIRGDGRASAGGAAFAQGAPIAALLATFGADGTPVLGGVSDQVTAPYARFSAVLGPDPVRAWLRTELARAADRAGIDVAALGSAYPGSPNTLAQPVLADVVVDAWGADEGAVDLRGAEVRLHRGVPLLFAPHHPRPLAVFGFSAASLSTALDARLRQTSFVPEGGHVAKPADVGFEVERDGRPSARVCLADGSTVRARRTVLTPADRAALMADPEGAWAALADRHGWPELVAVRIGREPELRVPRDCPLAVDAALHDAPADALVAIEEPADAPWLRFGDEDHVAQLAVPFARSCHAWSELCTGDAVDHAEPRARSAAAGARVR